MRMAQTILTRQEYAVLTQAFQMIHQIHHTSITFAEEGINKEELDKKDMILN
jgi:hypothetical protein